ncbi:hypothetical protein WOLCODRAFT_64132 [Wolfiporia cocos MD-104 SS10]|uniref:Uncharacterized protein n=1 Tax=Wolfiporia cocos (strain MD-104) TaxID=742152 RepID=A0A2H3J0M2_WOLCO|nr:hypothetical protein WOLCODRAFT_64132 [Wolfiporia cocos MD-104 SS10]
MASKISPNRRRSIAVLNQGPSRKNGRRRAHSIAPGEKLSEAARARRLLAPRKSILKGSVNVPFVSAESSSIGDENATQSMDFSEVHSRQSIAPRKSLAARRVSFASHAHVRLFDTAKQRSDSSFSQDSPGSQDSPQNRDENDENDENVHAQAAYARRRSPGRRRSSTAFSELGERSMDMDSDDTAPDPQDFLNQGQVQAVYQLGGTVQDDFSDEDDEGDSSMEITEAIRLNIERKRSLSLGGSSLPDRRRSLTGPMTLTQSQSENQPPPQLTRPPLTDQAAQPDAADQSQDMDATTSSNQSGSYIEEGSSADDSTRLMEFTVPMGRSLRPPEPPSEQWLQLRALTHAGSEPYEPPTNEDSYEEGVEMSVEEEGEPMELTHAVTRLMNARSSLGMTQGANLGTQQESSFDDDGGEIQQMQYPEDSFTSTDDSFADDVDAGDRTVNLTSLIRMSMGTQDSSMDAGSVDGNMDEERVVKVPIGATGPSQSQSTVFTAPPAVTSTPSIPSTSTSTTKSTEPPVFSAQAPPTQDNIFTVPPPKTPTAIPRSPAKSSTNLTIPKPLNFSLGRSASVPTAGPSSTPQAPKSPARTPVFRGTAAFAPPTARKSPIKRPAPPEAESAHQPSPTKRLAIGRLEAASPAPAQNQDGRRASTVRRPSGYFAQRRSLGSSAGATTGATSNQGSTAVISPIKVGGRVSVDGRARASAGVTPSGQSLTARLLGTGGADGAPLYPDVAQIIRDDPPTPSRVSSPLTAPSPRRALETIPEEVAVQAVARASSSASPQNSPPLASTSTGVRASARESSSPAVAASASISPIQAPPASSSPSPDVVSPAPSPPRHDFATTGITLARPSQPTGSDNAGPSTAQWREEVQDENAYEDDEGVSLCVCTNGWDTHVVLSAADIHRAVLRDDRYPLHGRTHNAEAAAVRAAAAATTPTRAATLVCWVERRAGR